jgi:hypothetical protein
MEKLLGWTFDGAEDMTGLPEYRNGENDLRDLVMSVRPYVMQGLTQGVIGGLLIDLGVLTLRPGVLSSECYPDESGIPRLPPSHPAVVEWRAMTVIELSVSVMLGPKMVMS